MVEWEEGQMNNENERKNNERGILIHRVIMGSKRNLVLEKSPGIRKDDLC